MYCRIQILFLNHELLALFHGGIDTREEQTSRTLVNYHDVARYTHKYTPYVVRIYYYHNNVATFYSYISYSNLYVNV